ncbi:MAG: 23S rRNA (uracil(1939)-C(5))-methyltransferase RlmD [Balneolaceae bacterium]|nr:23S rRNA (uracil(1939)-C(5))-methyltransferase RlmD [Balneolaceae bacterium]
MAVKKGQQIELRIDSTAFKGKGVGRHEGRAVFVPGTAPGDLVEVRIVKKKKKFLEGKVTQMIEPSPLRTDPKCIHANVCGGCTWQHLPYPEQLKIKEQHVRDHIERIAGLDPAIVKPIIGCEQEFNYRNKMEYSFGTKRWLTEAEIQSDEYVDDTAFAAGMHAPGRYDKILNLKECHLQHEISFRILDFVRSYCEENNIPAFDTHQKTGYMRHLVIRNSHYTNHLMVNFVTFRDDEQIISGLCNAVLNKFPEITTVVNNINDQPNPTAIGRYENILHGPGFIVDHIGNHTFKIHANAFFQTNTPQAEHLYSVAREFCELQSEDHLFDLYCGVGTLTLFMAGDVSKVTGIELVDVAIENANFNAKENGVENVQFVKGDMKDTFNDAFLKKTGKPDVIITDPPRAGMHPDVVEQFISMDVPRLVYVSCNPSTMARDLAILKEAFEIECVQPVDMFPQTYHIEAVAKLRQRQTAH